MVNHRQHTTEARATAVVIGGSIAGLLAAAALARHFAQVIVLENDVPPRQDKVRKGAPQGAHVHGFLAAGCQALEQLLPGIIDNALAAGAQSGDMLTDAMFYVGAHTRFVSGQSHIHGLVASRPLLEYLIYQRVSAISNVSIQHGQKVSSLQFDASGQAVNGVLFHAKDEPQTIHRQDADLVLDASGRGTRLPQWLQQAGYPAAERDELAVNITYSSCFFERKSQINDQIKAVFVAPDASNPVPSGLMEQDGERWIVSCGSYGDRQQAPADLPSFIDYLKHHSAPEIHAIAQTAAPLGTPQRYHYGSSVRHRYDKLRRFPTGLLLIGDALCSFNPVYGQGMTIAARQALALHQHLQQAPKIIWRSYFRQMANIIADPWEFAITSDLSLPCVAGKRYPGFQLVQRYTERMMRAASKDLDVARSVLQVIHMLKPTTALFSPRLLWRVLIKG